MPPILCPALGLGPESSAATAEFLRETGLQFVSMSDPTRFAEMARRCFFGLIVATERGPRLENVLLEVIAAAPTAHIVLVERGATRSPRDRGGAPGAARLTVLPSGAEGAIARRAIRRAWFEGQVERVLVSARGGALPASLSCAVSKILSERVKPKSPESGEVTLCTTLLDLATRCGVSEDTLRRARRRFGLDLRAMMQEWRVALALREFFIEDDLPRRSVWDTLGRRCGYEGESGIRGLIGRVLNVGLDRITFEHLQEVLERLHSRVEEVKAR